VSWVVQFSAQGWFANFYWYHGVCAVDQAERGFIC